MAKQSKAEQVRTILKARGKKTDEQVLELVMKVGLNKSLARTYIANNTKRLKEKPKAKKAAAPKTTSNKKAEQPAA